MVQRDAIESGYSTPARTEDAGTSTDPAGGVVADDRPLVLGQPAGHVAGGERATGQPRRQLGRGVGPDQPFSDRTTEC